MLLVVHPTAYLLLYTAEAVLECLEYLRISFPPHAVRPSDPVLTPNSALLVVPLELIATVVSLLHRIVVEVEIPETQS